MDCFFSNELFLIPCFISFVLCIPNPLRVGSPPTRDKKSMTPGNEIGAQVEQVFITTRALMTNTCAVVSVSKESTFTLADVGSV